VAQRPGEEPATGRDAVVELRCATLPGLLRAIAIHCWFAIRVEARWTRWEVWQHADAGGVSYGHVHRDLMHVDRGVGGGPARRAHSWRGAEADRLIAALSKAPDYPARDRYRPWPGPNSNTFVRWALDGCRLRCPLDARAIGKDYRGLIGARLPPGEIGVSIDTVLCGAAVAASGIEVHALGLTLGVSWRPMALKTPIGDLPSRAAAVDRVIGGGAGR
jgi:hypothetical protein